MIAVRHALLEEYDAAAALSWHVFEHLLEAPGARETVAAITRLREGGELIVAVADAALVGLVVYLPPEQVSGTGRALIRLLGVDPRHRRRGAGRRLVDACVTLARPDGATTLAMPVPRRLHEAAAFCAAIGLEPVETTGSGSATMTWQRSVR